MRLQGYAEYGPGLISLYLNYQQMLSSRVLILPAMG